MADTYPQKDRSELRPDGQRPCYHPSSEGMDGHMDSMNRMPHPQDEEPPTSESGEGKGFSE